MAYAVKLNKIEEAKQQAETRNNVGNRGPSAKFFKFDGSTATLRIMPPWTGEGPFDGQFWRIVAQHWKVSDDMKAPIICPKNTPHLGGDCPICDFVDELRGMTNDPAAKELANDIRAKQSYLFTVVDVDNPIYTQKDLKEWKKDRPDREVPFSVGDAKLQVYAAPFAVYNAIIALFHSGGDIVDLEKGHNVKISKQGKGINTKYTVTPELRPTKSNVDDDHPLVNLAEVTQVFNLEKLNELLEEGVGGEFRLVSGTPKKSANKLTSDNAKSASKKAEELDDDDDDNDLDDDDDDEDDLSFADDDD